MSAQFEDLIVFVARAFSAGTSTALVAITRRLRLTPQRLEFIPRLQVFAVEGFHEAFAFLAFDQHHHLIGHGQHVNDLAFALRCDNPLVALRQFLTRRHILLIFVDETAAQTTAHAGDLIRGERDALILCHLDRDRREIGEKFGAAAGFEPASAHAADDFRHIARTDLSHLDLRVRVQVVHVLFKGLEIHLFFTFRAEQEGESCAVVVVLGGDDFHTAELELRGAGTTVDHRFGLFGLPGLEQQQIAGRRPPLYGSPAAFRFLRRVLHDLDYLAEVSAPRCIYDDMLADCHVGHGGSIEVVNFSYFGETYTNNVSFHAANYTVSEFGRLRYDKSAALSLPGVFAAFFTVFIPTIGGYVTPLLVGGSRGFLYGNIIQDFFTKAANWPLGSALSMIMLIATLVLVALATRLINFRQLFE
jgi:hypothetical protein